MHYNPADFMCMCYCKGPGEGDNVFVFIIVEMVSLEESRQALIGTDPVQESRPKARYKGDLLPRKVVHCTSRSWWQKCLYWAKSRRGNKAVVKDKEENAIEEYPSSPRFPRRESTAQLMITNIANGDCDVKVKDEGGAESPVDPSLSRKWPTPWYWQLLVLTARTFRQSRHIILSKLNIIQCILIAIVISMIWFQIPEEEYSISDRRGFVSMLLQ